VLDAGGGRSCTGSATACLTCTVPTTFSSRRAPGSASGRSARLSSITRWRGRWRRG
jgi:hypothetical protein